MAPFDRPIIRLMTIYSSAIVNIALVTFNLSEIVTFTRYGHYASDVVK